MRIIRFISEGEVHQGVPIGDTAARKIEGDLFGAHEVTGTVLTSRNSSRRSCPPTSCASA
jgi:hypothetical protein